MGRLTVTGLDSIMDDLAELAKLPDCVITDILNAEADVIVQAHRTEIENRWKGPNSLGILSKFVKKDKIKKDQNGCYTTVYLHGNRKRGGRPPNRVYQRIWGAWAAYCRPSSHHINTANADIKGSQSGTMLRSVLTNLTKPSDTIATYMDELGVSLTDNAGNVRSLSDLMEILRDRFANLTETEQAEYAVGLAGKEAMSSLLAIVNASDADFQKLTGAATNCNGAAYEMSQIRLDNLAGQMMLSESAVDGLKLAVRGAVSPGTQEHFRTYAFSWATEFAKENEWIVGAITGVTIAPDALAVMVGPAVAIATWVSASQEAGESTKSLMKSVEESKMAYEENAMAIA